jgi:hypothetical protein
MLFRMIPKILVAIGFPSLRSGFQKQMTRCPDDRIS